MTIRRSRAAQGRTTVFEPLPLPHGVADALRQRLSEEHTRDAFSSVDPRGTVRRVSAIADDLDLDTVVYRGGVDVGGIEVDHVWLAVRLRRPVDAAPRVVDASFPLFANDFVTALRGFVAGDVPAEALAAAAQSAGVEERVVGLFPPPVRYLGAPVWSSST